METELRIIFSMNLLLSKRFWLIDILQVTAELKRERIDIAVWDLRYPLHVKFGLSSKQYDLFVSCTGIFLHIKTL